MARTSQPASRGICGVVMRGWVVVHEILGARRGETLRLGGNCDGDDDDGNDLQCVCIRNGRGPASCLSAREYHEGPDILTARHI